MAKISSETVDKLATLSRLEFDGEEKREVVNDLNRMLQFVDKLNEVDTSRVSPLIYMNDETNQLRNDEVKKDITQQDGLKNAPQKDSDYFKVPKVVEKK